MPEKVANHGSNSSSAGATLTQILLCRVDVIPQTDSHRTDSHGSNERSSQIGSEGTSPTSDTNTNPGQDESQDQQAIRVSRAIDRELEAHRQQLLISQQNNARILLLGPAASGKTTFIKQMKLLHGAGFTANDQQRFKSIVNYNMCEGLYAVLQRWDKVIERVQNETVKETVTNQREELLQLWDELSPTIRSNLLAEIPFKYTEILRLLSKDGTLQQMLEERFSFECGEAFEYFFCNRIPEMLEKEWMPTDDDILNARAVTRAVTEYDFMVNGNKQTYIDVSGQKSQRLKWITHFDQATSVLFFAPVGNYNQCLREDPDLNMLADAMALWDILVHHQALTKTSFILFLNKIDLFDSKLSRYPLQNYQPSYTGSANPKEAREFLKKQFIRLVGGKRKDRTYVHFTHATDRMAMEFILKAVVMSIQKQLLTESGVL